MKYFAPVAIFTILFSFSLLSCKSGIKEATLENPTAQQKLLITGNTSEFKDAVLSDIVDRYKDTCQIEIRSSAKLTRKDFDDYAALIIMDQCQAWMAFNTKTMSLIKKISDKDKIILFITAGDPDWTFSTQGIDAITSASEMARKDQVVDRIAARIDALIQ